MKVNATTKDTVDDSADPLPITRARLFTELPFEADEDDEDASKMDVSPRKRRRDGATDDGSSPTKRSKK